MDEKQPSAEAMEAARSIYIDVENRDGWYERKELSNYGLTQVALALDAFAARSRWQPIETAPKDGTLIILARYGWANDPGDAVPGDPEYRKRIFDNSRRTYTLWWVVKGHWSARWNNWNDGMEPSGLNQPTHWCPLPEPPSCP